MIRISKITINGYENSYFSEGAVFIGWQIVSDIENVKQTDYRIQIAQSEDFQKVLWDSGKVQSDKSQFTETDGFHPKHFYTYYVRVMIWDNHRQRSEWSTVKKFLYVFKEKIPWTAQWVSAPEPLNKTGGGIYIRKCFKTEKNVGEAFLIASAKGIYEPYIDGECISDELFMPGWTSYEKRIQYQIWNITEKLGRGNEHLFGCILAPGWFRGRLGETGKNIYGDYSEWIAQIYLKYEDGSEEWIVSDHSCECRESPLLAADMYDGEVYDARLYVEHWLTEDQEKACWFSVKAKEADQSKFCPQKIRGVCTHEIFEGKEFRTPAGEHCIDFGQNMAGNIEFKVKGKPGDKAEFVCFEALDKNGNVYTENLRSAKQTIVYYCRGDGEEFYRTRFSYQGFRYIHIRSWPGDFEASKIHAAAVYSDIPFGGNFKSSSKLLNRLVENIRWSMKSNFVDIPTDCPQRDERLGWTGDAQIFSEAAVYLANVFGFYEKWLLDVAGEQKNDGGIPHIIPDILKFEDQSDDWLLSQGTHSAAAWADAIVLIPWRLYLYYGNRKILESFYENMKRWIGFMRQHSDNYIWNYKLQFGDWLALDAPEESYFGATPNELTCTAYFAYSAGIVRKIAGILGKKEEGESFETLYKAICRAFWKKFLGEDGVLRIKTQTALAMSLCFGIIPKKYIQANAAELVRQIKNSKNHMTTGFMGTPCILAALSENGFTDEAYNLLLREEYPSWLYQVKKGATTVWEHLDGMKPDGSMWSSDMNSFNHYAYGTVAAWLFHQAAGIQTIEKTPGFKRFKIHPKLSQRLPKGQAKIETPYGNIEVLWKLEKNEWILYVRIPPNTEAEICLETDGKVGGSLQFKEIDGGQMAKAGSGNYQIIYDIKMM